MKKLKDEFLESLRKVFEKNPEDLSFKKYFALELYKKGEIEKSYPLLKGVFNLDKDLTVEKIILEIESKFPKENIGTKDLSFVIADAKEVEETQQGKKKKISFLDVAGMEEVKDAIRTDIIYPFEHPEIYKQYNKEAGGGILLFGPPGCGKTYIARATAGEIKANFFNNSIFELLSKYIGTGETVLHEKFTEARNSTPSVLFFDEIDAIGGNRNKIDNNYRSLVNQFLIELDGLENSNKDILIIGATNLPWEVDSALRRPGRLSKVVFVAPPDTEARKRIFEINLQKKPKDKIDYKKLAELTPHFSCVDIVHVVDKASDKAFKEAVKSGKVVKLSQSLLEETIFSSTSSIKDWFNTVKNYIDYSNDSGLFDQVQDYLKDNNS